MWAIRSRGKKKIGIPTQESVAPMPTFLPLPLCLNFFFLTLVSLVSPWGQEDCSQNDPQKTSSHGNRLPQPSSDSRGVWPTSALWWQVCALALVLPRFLQPLPCVMCWIQSSLTHWNLWSHWRPLPRNQRLSKPKENLSLSINKKGKRKKKDVGDILSNRRQ